jgi:hypothetical protein
VKIAAYLDNRAVPGGLRALMDIATHLLSGLDLPEFGNYTAQLGGYGGIHGQQPQQAGFPVPGYCEGDRFIRGLDFQMPSVQFGLDRVGLRAPSARLGTHLSRR